MNDKLVIEVYRHNPTGRPQVAIGTVSEDGRSDLYRLAGPGFTGTDWNLLSKPLDETDAAEIRRVLDAVFPVSVPDVPRERPACRRIGGCLAEIGARTGQTNPNLWHCGCGRTLADIDPVVAARPWGEGPVDV